MELYKTFIPGTESWLDVNNNRAFLAGELGVIANGISAYQTAKINKDNDPKLAEIAKDIRTTNLPIGPVGKSVELHQIDHGGHLRLHALPERGEGLSAVHVRGEADERLDHQSRRLLLPDAEGLRQQSGLDRRSRTTPPMPRPRRRCGPNGYAGPLGYASAATMADYVLVDMFAKAVTGQATPQEAMEEAEKRANRYYRVLITESARSRTRAALCAAGPCRHRRAVEGATAP